MKSQNATLGELELICSKDNSRYAIKELWYDAEKGRIAGTDGHIMAVAHVTPDKGEVSGFIPVHIMKIWRDCQKKSLLPGRVTLLALKEEFVLTNELEGETRSWKRQSNSGSFPNYEAVLPKVEGPPTFCVDLDLLNRAAKALGWDEQRNKMVAIWVESAEKAYLIKTAEGGPIGVIMPMRSSEKGWLTSLAQIEEKLAPKPKAEVKQMKAKNTPAKETEPVESPSKEPAA